MMRTEDQVCGIDLAKKLKVLGVTKDSMFYWLHVPRKEIFHSRMKRWMMREEFYKVLPYLDKKGLQNEIFSAFNVAELGEMLPNGMHTWKYQDEESVKWAGGMPGHENTFGAYENEADARASMLVYLLENKLMQTP